MSTTIYTKATDRNTIDRKQFSSEEYQIKSTSLPVLNFFYKIISTSVEGFEARSEELKNNGLIVFTTKPQRGVENI